MQTTSGFCPTNRLRFGSIVLSRKEGARDFDSVLLVFDEQAHILTARESGLPLKPRFRSESLLSERVRQLGKDYTGPLHALNYTAALSRPSHHDALSRLDLNDIQQALLNRMHWTQTFEQLQAFFWHRRQGKASPGADWEPLLKALDLAQLRRLAPQNLAENIQWCEARIQLMIKPLRGMGPEHLLPLSPKTPALRLRLDGPLLPEAPVSLATGNNAPAARGWRRLRNLLKP